MEEYSRTAHTAVCTNASIRGSNNSWQVIVWPCWAMNSLSHEEAIVVEGGMASLRKGHAGDQLG